jgi:hypothetical protein
MSEMYILFDTEWDNGRNLINIAWVVCDTVSHKVIKQCDYYCYDTYMDITIGIWSQHITWDIVKKRGISRIKAINMFLSDIANVKYIVAHNILADVRCIIINQYMLDLPIFNFTNKILICTLYSKKTKEAFNIKKILRLGELIKRCNVKKDEKEHTAMVDTQQLRKCFKKLNTLTNMFECVQRIPLKTGIIPDNIQENSTWWKYRTWVVRNIIKKKSEFDINLMKFVEFNDNLFSHILGMRKCSISNKLQSIKLPIVIYASQVATLLNFNIFKNPIDIINQIKNEHMNTYINKLTISLLGIVMKNNQIDKKYTKHIYDYLKKRIISGEITNNTDPLTIKIQDKRIKKCYSNTVIQLENVDELGEEEEDEEEEDEDDEEENEDEDDEEENEDEDDEEENEEDDGEEDENEDYEITCIINQNHGIVEEQKIYEKYNIKNYRQLNKKLVILEKNGVMRIIIPGPNGVYMSKSIKRLIINGWQILIIISGYADYISNMYVHEFKTRVNKLYPNRMFDTDYIQCQIYMYMYNIKQAILTEYKNDNIVRKKINIMNMNSFGNLITNLIHNIDNYLK